jgi:hypothetical protein
MESWMKKILLELNSISRVAVIEQAYGVEKMLRYYTKLLKYRWSYEGTAVIASMEFAHLEMLVEYYQVKWSKGLTFEIEVGSGTPPNFDLKSVMIPHFTFCSTLISCLEEIQGMGMPAVHIKVLASTVEGKLVITMVFQGDMDCQELKEQLLRRTPTEYDSFCSARKQWMEKYGEASVVIEAKTESLKIKYLISEAN